MILLSCLEMTLFAHIIWFSALMFFCVGKCCIDCLLQLVLHIYSTRPQGRQWTAQKTGEQLCPQKFGPSVQPDPFACQCGRHDDKPPNRSHQMVPCLINLAHITVWRPGNQIYFTVNVIKKHAEKILPTQYLSCSTDVVLSSSVLMPENYQIIHHPSTCLLYWRASYSTPDIKHPFANPPLYLLPDFRYLCFQCS